MIIYNITTKVHRSVETAWVQWQKEEYIPETMATGLFTGYQLLHLLEQDDLEGETYAVQYTAASAEQYNHYVKEYAPQLRRKALQKWGDAIISFRSLLEVIH